MTANALKIEEGKKYLTRAGGVADITMVNDCHSLTYSVFGLVGGVGPYAWTIDGKTYEGDNASDFDLISEHTETPAIDFAKMVKALSKPGADIIFQLTNLSAHLMHMAIGVSGESGELLDAIKKHVIYGKPLDRKNVIEEIGDIEFYLEGLRAELDITREETIAANIEKLGKRYSAGTYSDQQAQARADKAGE